MYCYIYCIIIVVLELVRFGSTSNAHTNIIRRTYVCVCVCVRCAGASVCVRPLYGRVKLVNVYGRASRARVRVRFERVLCVRACGLSEKDGRAVACLGTEHSIIYKMAVAAAADLRPVPAAVLLPRRAARAPNVRTRSRRFAFPSPYRDRGARNYFLSIAPSLRLVLPIVAVTSVDPVAVLPGFPPPITARTVTFSSIRTTVVVPPPTRHIVMRAVTNLTGDYWHGDPPHDSLHTVRVVYTIRSDEYHKNEFLYLVM